MAKNKRRPKYKKITQDISAIITCKGGKRCKGVNCPLFHDPVIEVKKCPKNT